ncbi:hypothetical protein KVT40_007650 [Elsinoe batatas]|uniref:Uncharacterized protein n=1 Tax=Elsinoe batatas TaxID=2601811 RepID=A0A8K0PEU2_9PEZI|nr:hypothetical protein KVT40_007650 [Elsinoe batatas]
MPLRRKRATKKTISPTSNDNQTSANPPPSATMTINPARPIFTRGTEDDTVTVPSLKCYLLDLPAEIRMMIYDCLKTTNDDKVYFRYYSGEGWVEMVGRRFDWFDGVFASTRRYTSDDTRSKHHFLLLAASCTFFQDELSTLALTDATVRLEIEATLKFQRASVAKRAFPQGLGSVIRRLQLSMLAGPGFFLKTFQHLMTDLELGTTLKSFAVHLKPKDGFHSGEDFKKQVGYFLETWRSLLCNFHTMVQLFDTEKERLKLMNTLTPQDQTALFDRMARLNQCMRAGQNLGISTVWVVTISVADIALQTRPELLCPFERTVQGSETGIAMGSHVS